MFGRYLIGNSSAIHGHHLTPGSGPRATIVFVRGLVLLIAVLAFIMVYGELFLILCFLLPFGLIDPHNLITFAYSWIGKLVILVLTIFPMWCGLHRIHHAMHDLKIHVPAGGFIFYGLAMIYTIWVLFAVLGL